MQCAHGRLGPRLASWCRHRASRRHCRAFAGRPERPDLRKLAQLAQIAITDEEARPADAWFKSLVAGPDF